MAKYEENNQAIWSRWSWVTDGQFCVKKGAKSNCNLVASGICKIFCPWMDGWMDGWMDAPKMLIFFVTLKLNLWY